jgi:hypothetical protein
MVASWRESGWRDQVPVTDRRPSLSGTVPDPQHGDPSANPGNRQPDWVTDGGRFEYMPEDLVDSPGFPSIDGRGRTGIIDREPQDHDYGTGPGAALTPRQSQAQNAAARSVDLDSVTSRRYSAPARQDGTYHVDRLQEPVYPVGSPGSLIFQQEANPETSPNASIRGPGHRIASWWDRTFQTNDWRGHNDHRPLYVTNAYTAPEAGPVPNGNQYTSPYATAATTTVRNVVTVVPQLRRNPRPWDEATTTDGSEEIMLDPGFYSAGL